MVLLIECFSWQDKFSVLQGSTRAICKVCGLTLWLRVGTLWRCNDSLFLKVPPLV